MSPSIQLRTVLIVSAACFAAGCVTAPEIDPADLPPEALVDNGIDYYSSTADSSRLESDNLGTDELLSYNGDQWNTDENGNKIYHLNQMPRGQSSSYYVGDIRYNYANGTGGTRNGTGFGNTPADASRIGWPNIRGSNANTYFQTRRGRIIYLPNNYRPPVPATTTEDGDTSTSNGDPTSTPTVTPTGPRPVSRSVTSSPPRTTRRTAPRVSKPRRTTRRTDNTRREDK